MPDDPSTESHDTLWPPVEGALLPHGAEAFGVRVKLATTPPRLVTAYPTT
jgi:hypothetical protein